MRITATNNYNDPNFGAWKRTVYKDMKDWDLERVMKHRNDTWFCLPFALVRYFGLPAVWMLAGWWLMDVLTLLISYKRWDQPFIRYVRIALATLLLIAFAILLVQVVYTGIGDYLRYTTDGFELTYPSIPVLSYLVTMVTYRYPMIYSFFGIIFRFIGLPKRNK